MTNQSLFAEAMYRLSHYHTECFMAITINDQDTALFYGNQYHKLAESIKDTYGVDPRPAY